MLYNKRGTKIFKQRQITNPDPELPVDSNNNINNLVINN